MPKIFNSVFSIEVETDKDFSMTVSLPKAEYFKFLFFILLWPMNKMFLLVHMKTSLSVQQ